MVLLSLVVVAEVFAQVSDSGTILFFLLENSYKNIKADICQILGIFLE